LCIRLDIKIVCYPKLDKSCIIVDRIIYNDTYLLDIINKEVILFTKNNTNKSCGYIESLKLDSRLNISDLTKFITIEFETIKYYHDKICENIPVLISFFYYKNNNTGYRAKKELNLKEKDFAGLLQNHL
jgi:hypothetical protein